MEHKGELDNIRIMYARMQAQLDETHKLLHEEHRKRFKWVCGVCLCLFPAHGAKILRVWGNGCYIACCLACHSMSPFHQHHLTVSSMYSALPQDGGRNHAPERGAHACAGPGVPPVAREVSAGARVVVTDK